MTRLFGRKDDKTTIAELEEYYSNQNQKKNRTGTAWLMAILSILITVAVIVLLFLGGRWVYRVITGDDEDLTTTTSQSNGDSIDLPTFDGDIIGQGNSSNGANSNESGTDDGINSSADTNSGTVSDSAASTSESNADRIAAESTSVDQTPATDSVPNTGAGEIILVAPVVAAFAGYAISRKRQIKENI